MDKPEKRHKGIIGRYYEETLPVIVKFVNELPGIDTQKQLTSLTVVSCSNDDLSTGFCSLQEAQNWSKKSAVARAHGLLLQHGHFVSSVMVLE